MGVGYQASPLHRISYQDRSATTPRPAVRGEDPVMDALIEHSGAIIVHEGPMRFRSPAKADILAWRERIARTYRDQLGEDLSWDEDSGFELSEDAATSADMLLRFVAAVLDQQGPAAARALAGRAKPPHSELDLVFAETDRRGFTGQYPQLLLGARYWFPFQRDMIIEEPSWEGAVERYGSLFRLADEVREVRAFIAGTDPSATAWTAQQETPQDDVLAAAWQASDTVWHLSAAAMAQRVPLWTTG
jgi:hypothetical protein